MELDAGDDQTWDKAEDALLVAIKAAKIDYTLNQVWRDKQDDELGLRMAAQECDCDFLASGDTVFEPEDLSFYEQTYLKEPAEKRGIDGNLWIWEQPDYSKSYMVVADVARGDSKDYSAFHVFDIETCVQVGEYKGKLEGLRKRTSSNLS